MQQLKWQFSNLMCEFRIMNFKARGNSDQRLTEAAVRRLSWLYKRWAMERMDLKVLKFFREKKKKKEKKLLKTSKIEGNVLKRCYFMLFNATFMLFLCYARPARLEVSLEQSQSSASMPSGAGQGGHRSSC